MGQHPLGEGANAVATSISLKGLWDGRAEPGWRSVCLLLRGPA